jgi:hypothetical protein
MSETICGEGLVKSMSVPKLVFTIFSCLVAGILLSACTQPSETSKPETEENGRFLQVLSLLPDTPDTRHNVRIDDYARVRELLNITISSDDEQFYFTIPEFTEPLGSMFSRGFFSGLDTYAFQSPIKRNNVGFGPLDVDMDLTAGSVLNNFEIVKGRYDPQRTAEALAANQPAMAREKYTTQVYKDVVIHSWGEVPYLKQENMLVPPVFDRHGRAFPMAVIDGYAFRYPAIEGIKAMIDLSRGEEAGVSGMSFHSLAAVPEYALLARLSEQLGAFSVYMTDQGKTLSAYPDETFKDTPLLRHYKVMALGAGKDKEGLYMTVVLLHDSTVAAEQNVELLRRRINETSSLRTGELWSNIIEIVDIHSEGTLLLARTRGILGSMLLPYNEPLFLQEEARN